MTRLESMACPEKKMLSRAAADIIVLLHVAFIVFVAAGGLLVLRWQRLAWFHVPAVLWGALIELMGWICPLTPLENRLRRVAGADAYDGSFIDRYIMPIVYPVGLTRTLQIAIGCSAIAANLVIYGIVLHRRLRQEDEED
jgi:uncharacterized membrane protein YhhN